LSFDVQFLVSAGEASGDMYAAGVVERLRRRLPAAQFFGCAGAKLQAEGVEPVVDAADLSVVGLAEVVHHLPRIYGEYRKLAREARRRQPVAALLTDNPDFHLRLARGLKEARTPVFYLVAPQVWAWRQGRVKTIRALVDQLFCLFPFEEAWFRERGVNATYIGHPLAARARVRQSHEEFLERYGLARGKRTLALLPGSRAGEARRHLGTLLAAAGELRRKFDLNVVLATPSGFRERGVLRTFREPIGAQSIKIVENDTWDAIGHADLALAASGTVTIEAAVLGTPMVTFYKVTPLSWYAGRHLVKVPFLSMVNLVAGREIVPELMQQEMTASRLVAEASELLTNEARRNRMRADLAEVRAALTREGDPLERVAAAIAGAIGGQ
jgi:lipid-A-disaccharide synthase